MTTNLKLTGTPDTLRHVELADPVWQVQHLAKAFGITVDRARRHARRDGFPAPKDGFERNCYCREAVLAWFRGLPDAPPTRSRGKHTGRPHPRADQHADTHPAPTHTNHRTAPDPQSGSPSESAHAGTPTPPPTAFYKPRRKG